MKDSKFKELFELKIWPTEDGREVPLINMKDSHIKNCIKAIKDGRLGSRSMWLKTFEEEIKKREIQKKLSNL